MYRSRFLGTTVALAAILVLSLSSVAGAHHGALFRSYDNIWIDHNGVNTFTATPGNRDLIIGLGGNDSIDAGDKRDKILGGRGADTIDAGQGRDKVLGGRGADKIDGGEGRDRVYGGPGKDTIDGGDGPDRLLGGRGADSITGGLGADRIFAGRGNDTVYAVDGVADRINCGPGEDSYFDDGLDIVADNCENDMTP